MISLETIRSPFVWVILGVREADRLIVYIFVEPVCPVGCNNHPLA